MTRVAILTLPLLVGVLAAAQPPKDPPKPAEPAHAGKPLAEWVKLLESRDDAEREKAAAALLASARQSDAVARALLAAVEETRGSIPTVRTLATLGPAAVPALTQGLWSADDNARWACLSGLKYIGPDGRPAAASVARVLADPDPKVRMHAAEALREVRGAAAIPALTKLLDDRDPQVRLIACEQLVLAGGDAAAVLPGLTADLKPAAEGNELRVRVLGRLGPEGGAATPALVALLPKADASLGVTIAEALGRIGPAAKDAVPALKKLAAVPDEGMGKPDARRVTVAVALWQIARDPEAAKILRAELATTPWPEKVVPLLARIDPGPETIDALAEALKAKRPEVAVAAAQALGTNSKDALPLLVKLLGEKGTRAPAVVALVKLGPQAKGALDALKAATRDEVPQIAFWAGVAVCRLDPLPGDVAAVAGFLANRDPVLRRDAAEVLGFLGAAAKPAAANLTLALDDSEEAVRLAAAVALWKVDRSPLALPAGVKLLRSPEPRTRWQATVDLGGAFGAAARPAVPDLVKALFDPYAAVRSAAAEALGRVGPAAKDAAPAVLAVLDADEPDFVHSAACEALGLIEPADKDAAAAALKRKLDHPDPLTRAHAGLSLFRLTGDMAGEKAADRGLGYRTHQVRITSAETLWRMKKDDRVVPFLVRTLEEANLFNLIGAGLENEPYMAARLLGRIGPAAGPAGPELRKLLTHPDPNLAAAAAAALKAVGPGGK